MFWLKMDIFKPIKAQDSKNFGSKRQYYCFGLPALKKYLIENIVGGILNLEVRTAAFRVANQKSRFAQPWIFYSGSS